MLHTDNTHRPLIFIVNCDWRDIFRTAPAEFEAKIKRDHLGLDQNDFFYLSFAHINYNLTVKNFSTRHLKTYLGFIKPWLDLKALWAVPLTIYRYHLRPTVWLAYDFGSLPALSLARAIWGGTIVMVLTNQPRFYSSTRQFGAFKSVYSFFLERLFSGLPNYFMTINETMKSYLLDLQVPAHKIKIFSTDTINRDQVWLKQARSGRVRAKLGLSSTAKIVLSVGRLEPEKNFSELITLFATLPADYVLIILGQGRMLASLQAEIKAKNLEGRVFFPGFVSREDIWNYYLDANVFVLLSKAEALGMVFWEAMYLGVPVIGSTASGIVETIGADFDRGRLWQTEDKVEVFKEKIFSCVEASTAKDAMCARAKAYVEVKIKNSVTLNDIIDMSHNEKKISGQSLLSD
ncbi:MAG: hypothetical protein A2571_01360 [Candidatus Vogelbacteria bacterium RIFOXYD1_FULL_44_32]|uniref:Glycosyl transferase family 1 domain-containing protein n=1 Tax=Candidatus Vogelbacteria bacterium RIFOXYD1_FULL_44_32 TaxID=1802438 RepID=A0A1G2QCW1_9BACT|nr:MAG: hypothetical protein A2571_01360 [Candidatus Vogelbacteria bacterium RIFOXYD1_FULL_44_32]